MTSKVARGRPKDPEKHAAIILAARELFAEQGFSNASMACLADRSCVSKATLYSHFKSKNDVFKAVILNKLDHYTVSFDGLEALPIEEGLAHFSYQLLELLHDREVIDMQRLVISESNSRHDLAGLFFETGPEQVMGKLTIYLRNRRELSGRPASDYRRLSETFCSLLIPHHYHISLMIGFGKALSKCKRKIHIQQVIKDFISILSMGRLF